MTKQICTLLFHDVSLICRFRILLQPAAQGGGNERETGYIYHYSAPCMHNLLEKDRPQWHTQIIHGNGGLPSAEQEYHSSILRYVDTLIWKCEIGGPLKNLTNKPVFLHDLALRDNWCFLLTFKDYNFFLFLLLFFLTPSSPQPSSRFPLSFLNAKSLVKCSSVLRFWAAFDLIRDLILVLFLSSGTARLHQSEWSECSRMSGRLSFVVFVMKHNPFCKLANYTILAERLSN